MGSGYGKAVLHFALSQRLRRAVGIECVISRHEIAQQALLEVRHLPCLSPLARHLPWLSPPHHARKGRPRPGPRVSLTLALALALTLP